MVDTNVKTPLMDLKELEELVSDFKAISRKRMAHDEEMMRIMGNPEIYERRINIEWEESARKVAYYVVEDSVLRANGSGTTIVGREEYYPYALRKG